MPNRPLPRVANFVSMNPNKRGPVELGMLDVGREWISCGGEFAVYYLAPPPDWYAALLDEAGITHGTVGLHTWHRDVLEVCAATHPDIVHLHMGRHTMAGELRRQGIHVLRTEHSDRQPRTLEPARRMIRWWQQRPLETFVCVSEFLARQTQRDFLVPPSRTRVVYNGCDIERFRPRPEDKSRLRRELLGASETDLVVTVAAHLIPRKQQHLLIGAMPRVLREVPNCTLVLAGDGPERHTLMAQAKDLQVSDRVLFLHGENDVAAIYAASDIGALTSKAEGLGGSAIEAQACGLPLIATPLDGLAETFIPERTGIAVDGTTDSVAEAMIRLLTDEGLRTRMGAEARAFVSDRFHPRRHVEGLCELYTEIGSQR